MSRKNLRTFILCTLLMLAALMLSACGNKQEKSDEALAAGDASFAARDYAAAVEQYETAIKYDKSKNPELYLKLAQALLDNGQPGKVKEVLDKGYKATGEENLQGIVLHGKMNAHVYSTYLSLYDLGYNSALDALYLPPSYEFYDGYVLIYADNPSLSPALILYCDKDGRPQAAEALKIYHAEKLKTVDKRLYQYLLSGYDYRERLPYLFSKPMWWNYQYDERGNLSSLDCHTADRVYTFEIMYGSGWFKNICVDLETDSTRELSTVYTDTKNDFIRVDISYTKEYVDFTYTDTGEYSLFSDGSTLYIDSTNHVLYRTDPDNIRLYFEYTPANRLRRMTSPGESDLMRFDYDLSDRLVTMVLYGTMQFSYNTEGFLSQIMFEDEVYQFEYDQNGRLLQINGADIGHLDYRYDEQDMVSSLAGHIRYYSVNAGCIYDETGRLYMLIGGENIGRNVSAIYNSKYICQSATGFSFVKDKNEWPDYVKAVEVDTTQLDLNSPGEYEVTFLIDVDVKAYAQAAVIDSESLPKLSPDTVTVSFAQKLEVVTELEALDLTDRGYKVLTDDNRIYTLDISKKLYAYMMNEVIAKGSYSKANGYFVVEENDNVSHYYYSFAVADINSDGDNELILLNMPTTKEFEYRDYWDSMVITIIGNESIDGVAVEYGLTELYHFCADYSSVQAEDIILRDNGVFEISDHYSDRLYFYSPTNNLAAGVINKYFEYAYALWDDSFGIGSAYSGDGLSITWAEGYFWDEEEISKQDYNDILAQMRGTGVIDVQFHAVTEDNVNQYLHP